MDWRQSAAALNWNIQPFIEGRYRPSQSTDLFDNINPANEKVLCEVPVGSAADVDEAVRVARKRFEDGCWSEMPATQRSAILMRFAELMVEHKEELALLDSLEMGKPVQAAMFDAAYFGADLLRSHAGYADKLVGESAPMMAGTVAFNVYEPRGVIGAITPWNFPSTNAVFKFGPALAAGNAIVLKPSELSSGSALKLAELALEAGVPEGVFNVVPGLGSTVGAALASHMDIDMLSFTGSTVTGRKIMELAGRSNGKPVLLECGGKSPQVVFGDIENLERVADAATAAILWNQGQVCSANTRLIAHADIKDKLVELVVARASLHKPGDPLDDATTFGPLASPTQRNRVKNYVEQGLKAGAAQVLAGAIQESGGCFVSPTVFDRVDPTMSIAQEEIFGPVLSVLSFKTDEEAIALANGTEYGLAATVWTRDMGRGKRMAHAIRAGHMSICTDGEEGAHSGVRISGEPQKASGFGSESGLKGLQSYSTLKSVMLRGV